MQHHDTTSKARRGEKLRVEEVRDFGRLEALTDAWNGLHDACPWATPFQHPNWLIPWYRRLAPGDPHLLAVFDRSTLVALLPLVVWDKAEGMLALAGTGQTDVLDVLSRPGDEVTSVRAALDALARAKDWESLELHELRHGSPLLREARTVFSGRITNDSVLSRCRFIEAAPGTTRLEQAVSVPFARYVRYESRRAARNEIAFEVAAGTDVHEYLDALERTHTERWRERGEDGVLDTPARRAFLREAVTALYAGGRADAFALRHGGERPRGELGAVYLVFRAGESAYVYLCGFDPSIAKFSPGTLLLGLLVDHLLARGFRTIDFLRGDETYKQRWELRERKQYRLRIERRALIEQRDTVERRSP